MAGPGIDLRIVVDGLFVNKDKLNNHEEWISRLELEVNI